MLDIAAICYVEVAVSAALFDAHLVGSCEKRSGPLLSAVKLILIPIFDDGDNLHFETPQRLVGIPNLPQHFLPIHAANCISTSPLQIANGQPRQMPAASRISQIGGSREKSVSIKKVESIFSTSLPFSSDLAFTLFHSGSSWKAFQFAVAASRLGCSRM